MTSFSSVYKGLNAAQKQAVDTVEGPVMVVAGPGTGKTQVLAVRTANILKKTQAKPSNILCLTFSTAGSVAMRERLRSLIGPDAYGVTVNTVHGFCDSIIRRHTAAFSSWADMQALSDIEQVQLLERLIDEISDSSDLIHPKNPYHRIPDILSRISDCKREGKTLEDLQKVSTEYEKIMSEKSKAGTKADKKNRLQAKKFADFVSLFSRYQQECESQGKYDYDDMILTVLKAFKEEDWLLLGLQERYQYILVDEAQDLNGAQWNVIEALTTYESLPHDPNVFIVGDDDQAIYRFQGANTAHLLSFQKRFPKAPVIVLTENYRSTQPILDAAGKLIAHNEERLIGLLPGLSKDLNAHTTEKGAEPTLLRPASDTAEPWLIADRIQEALDAGVPPDEIAVLVQTNRELRPLYDVLRARGIPVVLFGKADLLTHSLILQLLSILRFASSGTDDALLSALACEAFGCHPADVSQIAFSARNDTTSVHERLHSLEKLTDLRDRASLLQARDVLLALQTKSSTRTVLETVEEAIRLSGLISEELDPLDTATVEAFFGYVKERSLTNPSLTLQVFLQDLSFFSDENYAQLRLTYHIPHLVSTGVHLLTAHQSKGLEFHTVFLSSFREGHWDQRRSRSGLSVPEDLLFGWEPETKRIEKHEDERRLAYVAMTRAKRQLFFVCPMELSVGERLRYVSPSAFFAEAGDLPEEKVELKDPEQASLLLLQPKRELDSELQAHIRSRLEDFALSNSALTTFLKDPELFLRHYVLGIPEEYTESSLRALGYGNAIHWALRKWGEAFREGKQPPADELLQHAAWYLEHRTILTAKQRVDLLSEAKNALPRYVSEKLSTMSRHIHAIEQEYRAHVGDIRLRGKIDRIDRLSDTSEHAIVIDYKTGRPKSPSQIRGGVEEGSISMGVEGDNFRQLVFYALLLDQAEPLLTPDAFVIECVGEREQEPISREFQVQETEKRALQTLIETVWQKIHNLDFTPLRPEDVDENDLLSRRSDTP